MTLKIRESIKHLQPFKQGQGQIDGIDPPIKLSANESAFPPSPKAIEAYLRRAEGLNRYPDGDQADLRLAIADVYGLPVENIICGNGSEEIIHFTVRAFTDIGDEVLVSENNFVMTSIHSQSEGCKVVVAPDKDYRIDVDALLERVSKKTKAVIIANPNNPTGTYLPESEINRLHAGLPDDVLLLLDGAYAEYVDNEDYDCGIKLVAENENVAMTRTFSKAYGLAGLRIGWAYCPASMIDAMLRIKTPFNTNSVALAMAEAAVRDVEYLEMACQHVRGWQQKFQQVFPKMGIRIIDSVTNFYALSFADVSGKTADGASEYLQDNGIIARAQAVCGDQWLRISVGTDEENEIVIKTLQEYVDS